MIFHVFLLQTMYVIKVVTMHSYDKKVTMAIGYRNVSFIMKSRDSLTNQEEVNKILININSNILLTSEAHIKVLLWQTVTIATSQPNCHVVVIIPLLSTTAAHEVWPAGVLTSCGSCHPERSARPHPPVADPVKLRKLLKSKTGTIVYLCEPINKII